MEIQVSSVQRRSAHHRPAAKPDNPFHLTSADKLRMRLIKPALDAQGLGDAHENKGGAMVYRQTAISKGVRLQSKSLAMTQALCTCVTLHRTHVSTC